MTEEATGIGLRTAYVVPKIYYDKAGNQYITYVWEGAEIALIEYPWRPLPDDKHHFSWCDEELGYD